MMTSTGDGVWSLPILMYHSIPNSRQNHRTPLDVSASRLDEHLGTLLDDGWLLQGLTEALRAKQHDPAAKVVAVTIDDAYEDSYDAALHVLHLGGGCTVYVPTGWVGHGPSDAFAHPLLDWPRLRDLADAGVELGSHSVSHQPLDVLGRQEMRHELQTSREVIGEHTGAEVLSLCYPYGYANRAVRDEAARLGYRNACTVGRRIAASRDPLLALPRLQPFERMTGADMVRLVEHGEPGAAPHVKRLLHPAWGLVRRIARRYGKTLT